MNSIRVSIRIQISAKKTDFPRVSETGTRRASGHFFV